MRRQMQPVIPHLLFEFLGRRMVRDLGVEVKRVAAIRLEDNK